MARTLARRVAPPPQPPQLISIISSPPTSIITTTRPHIVTTSRVVRTAIISPPPLHAPPHHYNLFLFAPWLCVSVHHPCEHHKALGARGLGVSALAQASVLCRCRGGSQACASRADTHRGLTVCATDCGGDKVKAACYNTKPGWAGSFAAIRRKGDISW